MTAGKRNKPFRVKKAAGKQISNCTGRHQKIESFFCEARFDKDGVEFCDHDCRFSKFPKADAVDGSGSCRTFVALHCVLKNRLVHKNLRCKDKIVRKR